MIIQDGEISGIVRDAGEGTGLPGVNLILVGENIGAATDADDEFLITGVPEGIYTIEVRFLGFQTIEQQISVCAGETLELEFDMETEAVGLDELVVTGTSGDTRRRAVGNAISRVDASEMMLTTSRSNSYTRNHIGLPLGDNTAEGIMISSWLAEPGYQYSATGTTGYFTIAPEDFNTYDNQTRTDRYILGGTINNQPFEWFSNRLRVGYDLSNGVAEVFFPPGNPFAARTSLVFPMKMA